VTCGDGFDRVNADRDDVVAPDCEDVRKPKKGKRDGKHGSK
jgi:hypothetical protein